MDVEGRDGVAPHPAFSCVSRVPQGMGMRTRTFPRFGMLLMP
jgi:hypothetical protein